MATTSKQPLTWPDSFDGYTTHDKQEEALASDARYKILEWGRRAGKNVTAIIEFIEYARAPWRSQWGSDKPGSTKIWWVARSYDQAEKYGFLPMKSAIPQKWVDDWNRDVSNSEPYEIEFSNGVRIEFRTYDHPETLQGAGVDRMLVDEADYMKDELWYDDLEPMLMDTTGAVMFISKPVRPRSYFQINAARGQSSDWPEYFYSHATSADNPHIDEDPEDKRGTMPDYKFRQQYLAELPDDGGQVFTELSDRFFTLDVDVYGELENGTGEVFVDDEYHEQPYSVGVDIARSRDYRVTLALDSQGRVAYFKRSQNESWDGIQSHIEETHAKYPGIVVPDASRDNKLISDLWHAGVEMDPTNFSPQTKVELIDDVITAVEQSELAAPNSPAMDKLAEEMRLLEKEVTSSGYTKYHAPDSGHDDTVDALALAYKGLQQVARQATSTTASVGSPRQDPRGGQGIVDVAKDISRRQKKARKGWRK